MRENRFNIGPASQEVINTGIEGKSLSNVGGVATRVDKTGDKASAFSFVLADSINEKGWFVRGERAKEKYPDHHPARFANENDTVELFNIRHDGKYPTVSETVEFAGALKNTLGLDTLLKDAGGSARQLFAIVRNYTDGGVTFLPVAAPKRDKNSTKDTLSFNLKTGRNAQELFVNSSGLWRINVGTASTKLVVADSTGLEPIRFKLSSTLTAWDGPGSDENHVASIKKAGTGKYYRGDSSFVAADEVTKNDIGAHWKVEESGTGENRKWKFTPAISPTGTSKPAFSEKKVYAFSDGEFVWLQDDKYTVIDTVVVERKFDPKDFDLFDDLKSFKWKDDDKKGLVAIQTKSGNEDKYISYDKDNKPTEVVFATGESAVNIYKHTVKYLEPTDSLYKVPHYVLSYTGANRKEHFLKADNKGVSWDTTAAVSKVTDVTGDAYSFRLPHAEDGKIYLQNLGTKRLIMVSGDGSKLSASEGYNDYEFVNKINDGKIKDIAIQWTFLDRSDALPDEWVAINVGEEGTAVGVLTVDNGIGSIFIGSKDGFGVLSTDKDDPGILLTIKPLDDNTQSSPVFRAYSQTAVSDAKMYYHIMHDDLYLTDNEDARATFEESKDDGKSQKFASQNTATGEGESLFAIVSGEERYLSSKGFNLVFSKEEDRLGFGWGKITDGVYTGLKVVGGSSAKIYGVAGGVKAVNASGAVSIYTIDGRLVSTQAVTSPDQTIAVPTGIYIVKNGANVAKVVVK